MKIRRARVLALMACTLLPAMIDAAAEPTAQGNAYGDNLVRVVIVKIGNFTFEPAIVTVTAGTQIKWINEDDVPHTVTGSDPGSPLHSAALDTDDSYAVILSGAGTYKYFCAIHPHMVGTIVVEK
jgi:plastocyanin